MNESYKEFEHLRGHGVMILTPIFRDPSYHYSSSLLATALLFQQMGIRFAVKQVVGNSVVSRARNELVAAFLASPVEDAMFIDSDMQWQPSDVLRLLSSKQACIGAAYRARLNVEETDPRYWCIRALPESAHKANVDTAGAVEIEGAGTGFLRIKREVFARMIEAHPDWKRKPPPALPADQHKWYYQFFRFPENEEIGEDYYFCRSWREIGGSVWIDPSISIGHVGTHVYRGSIASRLKRVP